MADDKIIIKGARENNLKNIDLELPREIHRYDGPIGLRQNIFSL